MQIWRPIVYAILKKLIDAITFAGNVNLALIKRRKEALRPCLPAGVQKLCQKNSFKVKLLFGDTLEQQIELNEQSKLSAEIQGPLPGPSKSRPQRQSPYSRRAVRGSKPLRNTAYGKRFRPYGQSRRRQWNYRCPSKHLGGGLLGSPETLNAGNNSEVSANKKKGYLAKYNDNWSVITKNHQMWGIASQCKIDFINDSPHVQTNRPPMWTSVLRTWVQCHWCRII